MLHQKKTNSNNLFDQTREGAEAITRLKVFGNTAIRYEFVERYGVELLKRDLDKKMKRSCIVKVHMDTYRPEEITIYKFYKDQIIKVRSPIMPTVTIEFANKGEAIKMTS